MVLASATNSSSAIQARGAPNQAHAARLMLPILICAQCRIHTPNAPRSPSRCAMRAQISNSRKGRPFGIVLFLPCGNSGAEFLLQAYEMPLRRLPLPDYAAALMPGGLACRNWADNPV